MKSRRAIKALVAEGQVALAVNPHTGGVMIAMYPADPGQIAVLGGDPEDILYVTLAYLGKVGELEDAAMEVAAQATVAASTAAAGPFEANVSGIGALGKDDPPASVLLLEAEPFQAAYEAVWRELDDFGSEAFHPRFPSFIPHMTLGYGVPLEDLRAFRGTAVAFDGTASLAIGDERQDLGAPEVQERSAASVMAIPKLPSAEFAAGEPEPPVAAGIAVVAADTGRVLLLQRALDDEDPASGRWEFPGGHIDEGETPHEAAMREFGEECGLGCPGEPVDQWMSPDGVYVGFVHRVAAESDVDLNLDPEDRHVLNPDDPDGDGIEVVAWWTIADLPDMPALREEVRSTPWDKLTGAVAGGVEAALVARYEMALAASRLMGDVLYIPETIDFGCDDCGQSPSRMLAHGHDLFVTEMLALMAVPVDEMDTVNLAAVRADFAIGSVRRGTPIATLDTGWDAEAAVPRLFEHCASQEGVDADCVWKAYLFRQPYADATLPESYRWPIGDVINGRVTIIPEGIFAATREIQDETMESLGLSELEFARLRHLLSRWHRRLARLFANPGIVAPWDTQEAAVPETETAPAAPAAEAPPTAAATTEEPGDLTVTGEPDLALAPRETEWHEEDARARVEQAALATDDPMAVLSRAYLWVSEQPDPANPGDFLLLVADVIGEEGLMVVPAAVEEAAGLVQSGDVPEGDADELRDVLDGLYSRMAESFDDPALLPPWAESAPGESPAAAPEPVTTMVTTGGSDGELREEWEGMLVVEGVSTGDRRHIAEDSLSHRELPLPLMLMTRNPDGGEGHAGAELAGRIDWLEKRGNEWWGGGVFDLGSEAGREASRLMDGKFLRGVSVDLDDMAMELHVGGGATIHKGRIMGATLTVFPALAEASVYIAGVDDEEMLPLVASASLAPIPQARVFTPWRQMPALVASGGAPVKPPFAWFTVPENQADHPVRVLADGRVAGWVAKWGTCHLGNQNECVEVPRAGRRGYSMFHTGQVMCDNGETVATGVVVMDVDHANIFLSVAGTRDHYSHTGCGVADVHLHETPEGIWAAGAARPTITETQIRVFNASDGVSPDWRPGSGMSYDLVALLLVNETGYKVPVHPALVASIGTLRVGRNEHGDITAIIGKPPMHPDAMRLADLEAVVAHLAGKMAYFEQKDAEERASLAMEQLTAITG